MSAPAEGAAAVRSDDLAGTNPSIATERTAEGKFGEPDVAEVTGMESRIPASPPDDSKTASTPSPSAITKSTEPSPATPSPHTPTTADTPSAPTPIPTLSPHRLSSKQPKKGILKPPRPPVKPGLGGKLRDALGSIHPKFLDMASPGGLAGPGGQVSVAAQGLAAGPVGNIASGVMEGVGVVGGAAAALAGNLGGRFGRFVASQAGGGSNQSSPGGSPSSGTISLPWKLQTGGGAGNNSSGGTPLFGEKRAFTTYTSPSNPTNSLSAPPNTNPSPLSFSILATPVTSLDSKPLKRASFILPLISITYPISATNAPWSEKILQDRDEIEKNKNDEVRSMMEKGGEGYWTGERLVELYEKASKGREELARRGIVDALKAGTSTTPRTLLLTSALDSTSSKSPSLFRVEPPLNKHSAEALADLLGVEWGLKKLVLEGGVLDHDDALKPILHALLVSGALPYLSLANNRKIRSGGWRMIATYLQKARALRYLDLSDNILDKRSVDYLVQALMESSNGKPATALSALRREAEAASTGAEEVVEVVSGAEKQALEAEERERIGRRGFRLPNRSWSLKDGDGAGKAGKSQVQTLRMDNCSLRTNSLEVLGHSIRRSEIKNLSIRRNRINAAAAVAIALMIRDYPDNKSMAHDLGNHQNAAGEALFARLKLENSNTYSDGSTATPPSEPNLPPPPLHPALINPLEPEKLGQLVTLDVKSNDIRGGVSYIAQVLKRNTTLRVLNLSDNKIDSAGLVLLAQALRVNTTLDTLDLSMNPCCGPQTEGVFALKAALATNTTLKRLFLGSTSMTTESAIALAEGLPQARHLIHLDLTDNYLIETYGISALHHGLQGNRSIRCLDMTMVHADNEMRSISQEIMLTCVRNTEAAVTAKGEAVAQPVLDQIWGPIRKSTLMRQAKEFEESKQMEEVRRTVDTPAGLARNEVFELKPAAVLKTCEETAEYLQTFILKSSTDPSAVTDPTERQRAIGAVERGKVLLERVAEEIGMTEDPVALERLLGLNDTLTDLTTQGEQILLASDKRKVIALQGKMGNSPARPSVNASSTAASAATGRRTSGPIPSATGATPPPMRRHMKVPSLEAESPNFSIANSDDDDSDAEELPLAKVKPAAPTTATIGQRRAGALNATVGMGPKRHISLNGLGMGEVGRQGTTPPVGATSTAAVTSSESDSSDDEAPPRSVLTIQTQAPLSALSAHLDDTTDDERDPDIPLHSPLERVNKDWLEEEGEIFRKGFKLGVAEEIEEREDRTESGNELKQKILETEVARTPHRRPSIDEAMDAAAEADNLA